MRNNELQEAIERARAHFGKATLESFAAGRAMIDAAIMASSSSHVGRSDRGFPAEFIALTEMWLTLLDRGFRLSRNPAVAEELHEALRVEIERWERRSASDEYARPVLRAFLGLRELLWEFGVREPSSGVESERASEEPLRRAASIVRSGDSET